MIILVTGANGFVGGWLIRELSLQGHQVVAVVKDEQEDISRLVSLPNVRVVYCDLSDLNKLPSIVANDVDVIYHLAWVSAGGPGRADYKIQLQNTIYACDIVNVAIQLNVKKILFAGTISEKLVDGFLDSGSVATNHIYALSKVTTHYLTDILCKKSGLSHVWMQFANLYGAYSINGNIIGYTINELLAGRDAFFGPANQYYDFLYIEDLVKAMVLLGTNVTRFNTYYLGSGKPRILSDYLLEIGNIMGCPEKIKLGVRSDDGTRYNIAWFDTTPLVEEFEFHPSLSFAEGVMRTLEWMKNSMK